MRQRLNSLAASGLLHAIPFANPAQAAALYTALASRITAVATAEGIPPQVVATQAFSSSGLPFPAAAGIGAALGFTEAQVADWWLELFGGL